MKKSVLWPDLSRFGATLKVVANPTVGINFLKLSIIDRDKFDMSSGHDPGGNSLSQVMRDCGYTMSVTELRARVNQAYEQAQAGKVNLVDEDALLTVERKKLYYYSTRVELSMQILRQIIPAIGDGDLKMTDANQVKELDYCYLTGQLATQFLNQHQDFVDGKPGIFYTLSSDRTWFGPLQKIKISANEVLDFNDLPPSQRERLEGDERFKELLKFSSLPEIERLMIGQTLMSNGLPLRGPRLSALTVCYSSRDAAIRANNGTDAGIEEVKLPYGLPIAFDYTSRRLLVINDSRYLEACNRLSIIDDAKVANTARRHFEFIDVAKKMESLYLQARDTDVFDVKQWSDKKLFEKADQLVSELVSLTLITGSLIYPYLETPIDSQMLVRRSGLRANQVESVFSSEFLSFLDQFAHTIKPAFDQAKAEYTAADLLQKSIASTKKILKDSNDPKPLGERREDAGVKIGGARKDYALRCLSASEVDDLTERELGEVVCKDNIWPPLDYRKLRDDGVDPIVGWVIREARTNLPVNPLKGGYNTSRRSLKYREQEGLTREQCTKYISYMGLIRDAFLKCKKIEDLASAIYAIRVEAELPIRNSTGYVDVHSYPRIFTDAVGVRFRDWLPDIFVDEAEKSFKTDGLSRILAAAKVKTSGKWDWAIKEKPENENVRETKKEKPEPVFQHLEHIERRGSAYRNGDVNEETMMRVFNFRSIEYGNWLPQNERQEVLNHAFDAFMDLTVSLGLPPESASLGGELAIAFGSRGRGGKRAAMAHYEPARNVINLTRIKGAGSLAHEWGHAFDYWLSKSLSISNVQPLTSFCSTRGYQKTKLVADFDQIMSACMTRAMHREEFIRANLRVTGKNVDPDATVTTQTLKLLHHWVGQVILRTKPESPEVVREYLLNLIDDSLIESHDELGKYGVKNFSDDVNLSNAARTCLRLKGVSIDVLRQYNDYIDYANDIMKWSNQRISNARVQLMRFVEGAQKGNTKFLDDAMYYDGFRTKPYWSTKVELFARAFESFVQTTVEKQGLSQYLVHGTDQGSPTDASIYPVSDDRRATNAAFETFFKTHRLELIRMLRIEAPETKLSETLAM